MAKQLPRKAFLSPAPDSEVSGAGGKFARIPLAGPTWMHYAMTALPLMAVALGGSTARWSQAAVLLGLGAILLIAPPRFSVGRGLNAVLLGMLALAGAGFLPAHWFALPRWREALTDDFGAGLPSTLSPQPWLTAEALVLFLAGISWFYLMWTVDWNSAQKLRLARIYALGVAGLAGGFALLHKAGVAVPFWLNERHFGPFPNRNQTANFLALGAIIILACAHGRWRKGKRAAALGWIAALLIVAWALFLSFSRAGVAILFVGSMAYLWTETRRAARREEENGVKTPALPVRLRRIALSLTVVLGLLSAFLLLGDKTLERFRPDSAAAPMAAVTSEFRLRIQADAVDLVRAAPWCGIGLGNFAEVFPLFRHRSALPVRAIHPESDYLWVASELGWPGLALTLAGCALIARRLLPMAGGADRTLRSAAVIALAAFALHDLVDVSTHRIGSVLPALFVLGLALPSGIGAGLAARWPVTVFRALGLVFIGCGACWMLNAFNALGPLPGQQGVDRLKEQASRLSAQRDFAGAEQSISRAVTWAPLDWTLHFARGSAGLQGRGDVEEALACFRRARYLEPFMADVPLSESKLWLSFGHNALAINALAEACRREPTRAEGYIGDIFRAGPHDDATFHDQLSALTRDDPALDLPFLEQLLPPESVQRIADRLAIDPDLRRLNDPQKTRFFRIWAQRGNVSALASEMYRRADWQKLGWRWWAEALARSGNVSEACAVALRCAPRPVLPPAPAVNRSSAALLAEAAQAGDNPLSALQLYFARNAVGSPAAVLAAVRRITAKPGSPRYFHYLDAQLSGEAGEWTHAWEAWQHYLQEP